MAGRGEGREGRVGEERKERGKEKKERGKGREKRGKGMGEEGVEGKGGS